MLALNRWLGVLAVVGLVAGLVMGFGVAVDELSGGNEGDLIHRLSAAGLFAPREVTQGNVQRIMYLHVPVAFVAEYLACPIILFASVGYLWTRNRGVDRVAHAAAEVGVVFTALTITTGSIWGKPTWGTWWTWDARLTTFSILFVMFVGYLMLRSMLNEPDRVPSYAAVLGIILALNVPLVHFSVYWWRTLHQPPSLLKPGPSTIASAILITLLVNIIAHALLYGYFVTKRVRLLSQAEEARA